MLSSRVQVCVSCYSASLLSTTIRVSGLGFKVRGRLFLTAKSRSMNCIEAPLQEYSILPHSPTDYCLLFSLYHMFIIFVISY